MFHAVSRHEFDLEFDHAVIHVPEVFGKCHLAGREARILQRRLFRLGFGEFPCRSGLFFRRGCRPVIVLFDQKRVLEVILGLPQLLVLIDDPAR